jgi:hypothetical protein
LVRALAWAGPAEASKFLSQIAKKVPEAVCSGVVVDVDSLGTAVRVQTLRIGHKNKSTCQQDIVAAELGTIDIQLVYDYLKVCAEAGLVGFQ